MTATATFPSLYGQRIELVELSFDGLVDMFEYSRDARFYEFLEFGPHSTIDDTREYVEKLRKRMAEGKAYYWFVRLRSSHTVIGTIGVHSIDWRKRAGEIGYGIAPNYWRQGFYQEALVLVLRHLFDTLSFHRVAATTATANAASIRALKHAGFSEEGVLRDYYLGENGRRFDATVFSLLVGEYHARRGG